MEKVTEYTFRSHIAESSLSVRKLGHWEALGAAFFSLGFAAENFAKILAIYY